MLEVTHLDRLESESMHIIREAAAECRRPVLLYSSGKDSSVQLHLALKAFHPRTRDGDSVRVFPLSNWATLDVWQYI